MSVMLRLSRLGKNKTPFYRVVATKKAYRRDGRYLELLGTYNPMVDPPAVKLKEERVKYWISSGAQPSKIVESFIKKTCPGYIEDIYKKRTAKAQAKRKARKARLAKLPKKTAGKK